MSRNEQQINEEIRDNEIRLIGDDGAQLGIVSSRDALRIAGDKGLDLVKIAPQATPPVCRIMDYGKFRFEQSKREKEARKNQRIVDVKEIQLSPGIGAHDFDFKLRNALSFLEDGDKVKAVVKFRGREMAHTSLGSDLLKRFADSCAEVGTVEKQPLLEGRRMIMYLAPKTVK